MAVIGRLSCLGKMQGWLLGRQGLGTGEAVHWVEALSRAREMEDGWGPLFFVFGLVTL